MSTALDADARITCPEAAKLKHGRNRNQVASVAGARGDSNGRRTAKPEAEAGAGASHPMAPKLIFGP